MFFEKCEHEFAKRKQRMREYGFAEGIDFNPLKIEQVRKEGNRNVKRELQDYEITLEMAKELAMIQRNEKDKQA